MPLKLSASLSLALAASGCAAHVPDVGYGAYGLKGCSIGDPLSACVGLFGAPKIDGSYASFPKKGVQVLLDGDRVQTVFINYKWKDGDPFTGTLEGGIGATASPDDVIRRYGPPGQVLDSVVSEFGEYPGAKDHTIEYESASFTFYDGVLAHVALFKPKPKE